MKNNVLIIITILFVGCKNNQTSNNRIANSEVSTININIKNTLELQASNIFKKSKFIKLETSKKSLIGNIGKLKIDNKDNIYIESSSKIFIFNNKGKFLNKIGRKGKGPGEYLSIYDFYINKKQKNIEILDLLGQKSIKYDFNGNFIRKWNHNTQAEAFTKISPDKYVFYNNNNITSNCNYKLIIKNYKNNTPEASYFKITKNQNRYLHIGDRHNFTYYKNHCLFFYPENDTIYQITQDNSLKTRYIINFGTNSMPNKFLKREFKDIMEFMESLKKHKYASLIGYFFETEKHILFKFRYNGEDILCINHKNKKNTVISKKIQEDMNFSGQTMKYFIYPLHKKENNLFYLIEAYTFKSKIEKVKKSLTKNNWKKYKNKHAKIIELYNSTKYDDNPILGIYELK